MEADTRISTDLSQNNTEIISFFEKDPVFVFLYKKTEKLVSAVYMITNLFAENEPMKWALRKKAGELMSFILGYKDVTESGLPHYLNTAKTRILELVSLLEVSLLGGLISNMNFSILKREFTNLVETLNSSQAVVKEPIHESLSDAFFQDGQSLVGIKDIIDSQRHRAINAGSVAIKDNNLLKSRDEFKRSNRQNIILNLLKKKKELTIKDISTVIKDCSEKTIQRELIAFIAAGVLKRTGERRWSKYSLA